METAGGEPVVVRKSSPIVRWVAAGAGYQNAEQLRSSAAFVRPHSRLTAAALAAMVLAAVLEGSALTVFAIAIQSLFTEEGAKFADAFGPLGSMFDVLLGGLSQTATFFSLVGMAVVMVALRGVLTVASEYAASLVYVRVFTAVWDGLFRQFMSISFASFNRYRQGDLSQYIWDAKNVHALLWQTNKLLSVLVVSGVYLAVMLWLSWQMTFVAIISMILIVFAMRNLMRRLRIASEIFVTERVEMSSRATEYLAGGRDVRLFGMEDAAAGKVRESLDKAMHQTRLRMILRSTIQPSVETLAVAGVAVFMLIGVVVLGDFDRETGPKLLAFVAVIYRLLPRAGAFSQYRASIIDLAPVSMRVTEMLRTDNKQYLPDGELDPGPMRQGIHFENVTLRYAVGEQNALAEANFEIPAGKMTALVGASGAGKSTVADLVARLYDPTEGKITADGADLREFNIARWRQQIGVVSQQPHIFNDTIAANIAIGKTDASRDDVEQAASAAMATEFISLLENGYETMLGDHGYGLSGGQKQRLAIARALVRDPEILIFDEATSSLDSGSEQLIVDAIERIRKDRTLLVIAHRLSTITRADNILVLDGGRVAEQGTHEDLLSRDGMYAEMWRIQTD